MGLNKAKIVVAQAAAAEEATASSSDSPDSTWTKAKIGEWLEEAGIEFSSSDTKADLLALVP